MVGGLLLGTVVAAPMAWPRGAASSKYPPTADTLAAKPDQSANFGGGNPSVVVAGNGTVYIGWKSAYSNLSPATPRLGRYLPCIRLGSSFGTATGSDQVCPPSVDCR